MELEFMRLFMLFVRAGTIPLFLLVLAAHVYRSRKESRRYSAPFYPFKRWTWTGSPAGWREHLRIDIAFSLMFGVQAVWLFSRKPPYPGLGLEGLALFMSLSLGLHAGRIIYRRATIERGH
jgi:hypothetical protein